MTYRPRGPRRLALPGSTRPPDHPPLGERDGDDLMQMTHAERVELQGHRGALWRRHDSVMDRLAAGLAEQLGPTDLTPDPAQQEEAS